MNNKLIFKIILSLAVLLLIAEFLFLDFDNLSNNLTLTAIGKILVPILIISGMWLKLRELKKEEDN